MPRQTADQRREAWHENNTDLAEWLESYVGNAPLQERLTPMQARVLPFWTVYVQRGLLSADDTEEARDIWREVQDLLSMPAGSGNVTEIPNGTFDVRVELEAHNGSDGDVRNFQFQIWTVQNGRLEGQRIIKRREVYGRGPYRGFATLTAAGTLHLWQRFQADADEPYVEAARHLLEEIQFRASEGIINRDPIYNDGPDVTWHWSVEAPHYTHRYQLTYALSCRVCNDTETARDHAAMRDTGLCHDHWEATRLIETNPIITSTISASSVSRGTIGFDEPVSETPVRTVPLTMCEITGTEIQ